MSSWLKLKRLVHATKAWKAFTNKIPVLKLHKFSSRSKAIAKPYKTRTHKKLSWPILSLSIHQPNKFKNKRNKKPSLIQHKISHKKHDDQLVFVDKLFIEPPTPTYAFSEADHEAQKPCSSSSKNGTNSDDQRSSSDYRDHVSTADDMWESMIVASPQMQGINERAEEFIARFRADMRRQEMVARRL